MNRRERIEEDGLTEEPVEFYGKDGPWACFSNFSSHWLWLPHPFTGKLTKYRTGEYRYQAMKADNIDEHDWVNESSSSTESKSRGRQVDIRPGWDDGFGYYVMVELVTAKTLAHADVLKTLLETGKRAVWEDSPTDDIWGIRFRSDYRGQNLLGKTWMQVRETVKLTMNTALMLEDPILNLVLDES